jgi:CRP-like cAMP-binding protein
MNVGEITGIPLFADLGEEARAIVLAGGVMDVPAGQVLAQAGDHGTGMYVVLDGAVHVELRGVELEIAAGGFFGELALLVDDGERVARVRAHTDARVLAVPRATFDFLLETEPSFARAMLCELAVRLVKARTGDTDR